MFHTPLFSPPEVSPGEVDHLDGPAEERTTAYRFNDRIIAAVNVAMAARRPLLVTGEPGSGKSSLAWAAARELGRSFLAYAFTSRSTVEDLTAGPDMIRRLADAQLGPERLLPDWVYLRPGVLWWAFNARSATDRGHRERSRELTADQRDRMPRFTDPRRRANKPGTVVLLDEIDKADPDLPNDLLIPLDRMGFDLPGGGAVEHDNDVLIVITSNEERLLPPAFVRRCVQLHIETDDLGFFVQVARAHFGEHREALFRSVAEVLMAERAEARRQSRRLPSTAEYLDTVRACLRLDSGPGEPYWDEIVTAALTKTGAGRSPAVGGRT